MLLNRERGSRAWYNMAGSFVSNVDAIRVTIKKQR